MWAHGLLLFRVNILGKQKALPLVSVASFFRIVSQKIDTLVISLRFVITACVHGCAQSYSTLCNPRDGNRPAPLSIGFSRQEYWSGLPFPPPGDLPQQGSIRGLLRWQADSFTTEAPGPSPVLKSRKISIQQWDWKRRAGPNSFSQQNGGSEA